MANEYQSQIDVIADLLIKRLAAYPVRDESFFQLDVALKAFAAYLVETTNFIDFVPDADILDNAQRFADQPVFICGSMKSGTSLLIQLLDHHPDLIVMPGDSHFAKHLDRWDRTQFTDITSRWVSRLINPTGKEPFWFIGQDERTFRGFLQHLRYFLDHTEYDSFVCVVLAIFAVNSHTSGLAPKKYWVEKTPENELKAQELSQRFPKAKFIHILRDPLNNIASLKKHAAMRNWDTTSWRYAYTMRNLFQAAQSNQRLFGPDKYHLITYEALVSNSAETLQGICDFLEIPFDDVVLTPTENGRPGGSNSMFESSRVSGVILDQSNSKRYLKNLDRAELQDVVTILYQAAIALGYDWNAPDIKMYQRSKFGQISRDLQAFISLAIHRFARKNVKN